MVALTRQTSAGRTVAIESRKKIQFGDLEAEVVHHKNGLKTVTIRRTDNGLLNLTAEEWYTLTENVSWK